MGKAMKAGIRLAVIATLLASVGPAVAQKQGGGSISDKTVTILMGYAWSAVTPLVTLRSGKVVKFDKKNKRKEIE